MLGNERRSDIVLAVLEFEISYFFVALIVNATHQGLACCFVKDLAHYLLLVNRASPSLESDAAMILSWDILLGVRLFCCVVNNFLPRLFSFKKFTCVDSFAFCRAYFNA